MVHIYICKETRYITELCNSTNAKVTFKTNNQTEHPFKKENPKQPNTYTNSGIYQLAHPECSKKYVTQTGWNFLHGLMNTSILSEIVTTVQNMYIFLKMNIPQEPYKIIELLHVIKKVNINNARILCTCSPRELNFVQSHLIFSAKLLLFFLIYKNVYQFTCIKQKAPDNSKVHKSLQNCESSVRNLIHVTLLAS